MPALPPFIAIHKGSGRGRTGVPPQGEVAVHERGDCGKLAAAVSTTTPTSRFQSDWALNSREVPQGAVPGDGALDLDARLSERDPVAEAGRQAERVGLDAPIVEERGPGAIGARAKFQLTVTWLKARAAPRAH